MCDVYVHDVKPLKRLYIHCTTTIAILSCDAESEQINSTGGFKLDRVESSSNETKESSLFFLLFAASKCATVSAAAAAAG